MSSLIANEVKTNFYLVSIELFIVRSILCATISNLYNNNYFLVILLYTSDLLSTKNCSVDLYNGDLQTTTILFTRNFTLNSY